MGLLDFLSQPSGGGLFSFLNNQQQFPVGLPSDTAQYGSPMGAMAQAQPQPQAQPMQQPGQPMQAPQQSGMTLPPALGGGNAFSHIFAPNSLMGRLTGNDDRTIAQQNLKAQWDALLPILGPQKAYLAIVNPEAGKTLLSEALTNKEKFEKLKDAEGNELPAFVNDREQTVNGKPIDQYLKERNAAVQNSGQFGQAAPYPPPPPGVNGPQYAKSIAEKAAGEAADLQTRAEGAVNALKVMSRLRDRAKAANSDAFGPLAGSDTGQSINAAMGGIPYFGRHDSETAGQQSELNGLYTDAGSSMLKQRYGSRITNTDVHQGMKIVGGLTQPNKETALKTIDNNMIEAYDTLAEGIKRGVVRPQDVLQRPQNKQEADALGRGALYIAPDGSVRRNPQ